MAVVRAPSVHTDLPRGDCLEYFGRQCLRYRDHYMEGRKDLQVSGHRDLVERFVVTVGAPSKLASLFPDSLHHLLVEAFKQKTHNG